jgi:hypothetical protein
MSVKITSHIEHSMNALEIAMTPTAVLQTYLTQDLMLAQK